MNTNIQWYPGHMVKAKKMIQENIKLVDMVIEVVDARVPLSSRNPEFKNIWEKKPHLIIMNKRDLADERMTKAWLDYFKSIGCGAIAVDSLHLKKDEILKAVNITAKESMEKLRAKGIKRIKVRAMIVGIPNSGKSTLINSLMRKNIAKTGNRPGVTKGKQWARLDDKLELLDTPGVLWPKFSDENTALNLAFTNAIKDLIYDMEEVAIELLAFLRDYDINCVKNRYKLEEVPGDNYELMEAIGKKRGFLMAGGHVNTEKTAHMLIQEFRETKLGRITLDRIPEVKK